MAAEEAVLGFVLSLFFGGVILSISYSQFLRHAWGTHVIWLLLMLKSAQYLNATIFVILTEVKVLFCILEALWSTFFNLVW
jgi:hypothetical protein